MFCIYTLGHIKKVLFFFSMRKTMISKYKKKVSKHSTRSMKHCNIRNLRSEKERHRQRGGVCALSNRKCLERESRYIEIDFSTLHSSIFPLLLYSCRVRSLDDSFLVSVYSQISKRSHVIVEIVRNFLIYTFYLKSQKII